MKNIIIVSKCLRVTSIRSGEVCYEFHFKGVFAGKMIRKIWLKAGPNSKILAGEEYVIYANLNYFESGELHGLVVKSKPLQDCFDQS